MSIKKATLGALLVTVLLLLIAQQSYSSQEGQDIRNLVVRDDLGFHQDILSEGFVLYKDRSHPLSVGNVDFTPPRFDKGYKLIRVLSDEDNAVFVLHFVYEYKTEDDAEHLLTYLSKKYVDNVHNVHISASFTEYGGLKYSGTDDEGLPIYGLFYRNGKMLHVIVVNGGTPKEASLIFSRVTDILLKRTSNPYRE